VALRTRSVIAQTAGVTTLAFDPTPGVGSQSGFTLVELMIGVAVLAILAAVAYPSYQDSVRKGRRSEAFTALSAVQQAQERWRANHEQYASTLPGIATTKTNGNYTIAVSAPSATGYTATATAGGSQAADTACAVLGARLLNGNLSVGSGSSSIDWSAADPDAGRCWVR